jgi:hypothetical protein
VTPRSFPPPPNRNWAHTLLRHSSHRQIMLTPRWASLSHTATIGKEIGVEAPSEQARTITKECPNCLHVVSLPTSTSVAQGKQSGFPALPWFHRCHTPVLKKHRTETSIRVPGMFNHTHRNNMINRWNVSIKKSNIPYIMTRGSEKDYTAENSGIKLSVAQLPQAWPLERPT